MPFKKCLSCGTDNGPRSLTCKKCNKEFGIKKEARESSKSNPTTPVSQDKPLKKKRGKAWKPPKTKFPVEDWTTLQKGDIIKVSGGPYHEVRGAENISMGEHGKFRVSYLDIPNQAIFAYGLKKMGLHFIYMGAPKIMKETGTIYRAHKVILIKPITRNGAKS